VAKWYVTPRLATLPLHSALQPLPALHAFRHLGMVSLVPTVVGSALPARFAVPAAYGGLLAGLLALAAIVALRAGSGVAVPLTWLFKDEPLEPVGAGGDSRGGGAIYAAALQQRPSNIRPHPPIEPVRDPCRIVTAPSARSDVHEGSSGTSDAERAGARHLRYARPAAASRRRRPGGAPREPRARSVRRGRLAECWRTTLESPLYGGRDRQDRAPEGGGDSGELS
jgi:hypothetical protein